MVVLLLCCLASFGDARQPRRRLARYVHKGGPSSKPQYLTLISHFLLWMSQNEHDVQHLSVRVGVWGSFVSRC